VLRAAVVHTEPIAPTKYQAICAAEAARGGLAPRHLRAGALQDQELACSFGALS
jgi:hypothetical protein